MRKIIHVDMDAFYASVEQRDDPSLREKPLIVAWSGEARSVVVAASYEARKYGIHSAMPVLRALRLYPEILIVKPDFERYRAVSRQIREVFERHTPLVEPLSLDEAYLDVTEELTGIATATATAEAIRREIVEETQLTASAGVAPNKFLAKIASDWRKPDGLFVIKPPQVLKFLEPLPVSKLPGVGSRTAEQLTSLGLATVGQLRAIDRAELIRHFGKFGERLAELSHGIDENPVVPHRPVKSISSENTFSTDLSLAEVEQFLVEAAGSLWESVSKKQRVGRTVTVKLRSADFRTATRRSTPDRVPESGAELAGIARELLTHFTFEPECRFRLAGVGLSNFVDDEIPQNDQQPLFGG